MAGSKRLIVGLGNPGSKYAGTRHNVGFDAIDALASRLKLDLREKGESLIGWGKWRGRPVGLLKPQTFMNRSGLAVEKIVRDQKLSPEDIFVIVDDINLPVGKCRIRSKGGDGGHNGIEDIIDWLDDDSFPRCRIGIGSNFDRGQQANYVLSVIPEDEKDLVQEAVKQAADAALSFVTDGIVQTMNRHSR
jgi:peptidyl-tRNA hydrolase, PTH1 family